MTSAGRQTRRLLRSGVGPSVALTGGIFCLIGVVAPWRLVVGGVCVAMGVLTPVLRLLLAQRERLVSTFWLPLRFSCALTLAVGCLYVARQPRWSALTVLAAALMLGVLWWVRSTPAVSYALLQASNLPGLPANPQPRAARWPYGFIAVAFCVWLLIGFVAAALALPALVLLGLSVLSGGMMVVVALEIRPLRQVNLRVQRALRELAPTLAMPYNGHAIFHLEMWAPFLERTGEPIVVITTDPDSYRRVSKWGRLPAVYAPDGSPHAIRAMFPSSIRAAFYVYNGGNDQFVKIRRITHVFVHHGDSDKHTSSVRGSARYDVLVVSGQAAIDRYTANNVDVDSSKFRLLGRPQTELIQTVTIPIAGIDAPVVLYAPTWQGENASSRYSSLLFGERIVEALLARGATVIFRPHPAARNYPPAARAIKRIRARLVEDARSARRAHIYGGAADKPTVAAVTNMADAIISDVSGIVTDFMASLKPFAMVASWTDVVTFRTEIPTSLSAYVIAGDLENLEMVLRDMLGPDPLAATRVERRRYYLGDFDGAQSAEAFVAYARALATGTNVDAVKTFVTEQEGQTT